MALIRHTFICSLPNALIENDRKDLYQSFTHPDFGRGGEEMPSLETSIRGSGKASGAEKEGDEGVQERTEAEGGGGGPGGRRRRKDKNK